MYLRFAIRAVCAALLFCTINIADAQTNTNLSAVVAFNPKNYGAIGDGTVHTIASTLGITTLVGLQNYTVNGVKPYVGIGAYPVGNYAALPAMQPMADGATQIPMYTVVTVGGPSYTGPIAAGSTFIPIGYDGQSVGMGNLKPNMQCGNSSGVTPGSSIFVLNPAASVIELATPTTASLSAGATFTCGYNLSQIAIGATVTGFNLAPNTKVVGISNYGVSQSIQISPGVTSWEAAFTPFEFWSPLTDSQVASATMDWLGIQAAYVAAGNTVPVGTTPPYGGGTVFIPNGFYVSNLGLQIPQQNEVDTKGSGMAATVLNWNTDTGPGTCFLNDGFRLTGLNTTESKYNVIQDLSVLGPVEEYTYGSTNVNACGISVNGYKKLENTQIQLTFAGVVDNGGQGTLYNVNISHNYYGVYFDMPDTYGNFGDNLFENVEIDGATMADVACSVSFCDPGSTWLRSGFFDAPYGYFTETYGMAGYLVGGPSAGVFLNHNELINVQAENIGHAMIGDDRPFGQSVALGIGTIWQHFEPNWGQVRRIKSPILPAQKLRREQYSR